MENDIISISASIVRLISEQFLCCTILKKIDWQNIFELPSTADEEGNYKLQDFLLAQTVDHPINLKFPLRKSYLQNFLKYIILKLEEKQVEVSELLYSRFQELLNSETVCSDFNYKHYTLPNGQFVTLNESTSIISEGTTGLCSWQVKIQAEIRNHKAHKSTCVAEEMKVQHIFKRWDNKVIHLSCLYSTNCQRNHFEGLFCSFDNTGRPETFEKLLKGILLFRPNLVAECECDSSFARLA